MEEENKEPLKVSVNEQSKTITVSKGYSTVTLSDIDCRVINILYDKLIKGGE